MISKMVILFSQDSLGMKVVYVSVPLYSDTLQELKLKSGKKKTKEALAVAVLHYLSCDFVD